jgi:ABC-type glycerol-3-phosphate transport system substrate-binding protein
MIGGGRVLLYRTDVLDEYGFEPPETLKDLVEIGTEITKSEDGMYGFLNTTKQGQVRAFQEFMTHMFQMGDGVFALEDGEWSVTTTPDDIGKVFKWFYHDMYNGDGATPANPDARGSDWQAVDIGYLQGNHAMAEGGNWVWGFTDRAPDAEQAKEILENTGAAKIPNAPGAADPMSTWLGATPTMLSANSDAPEAAWTALREHASPTMIEKYGQTSSKFLGPPMITSLDSVYTREDRQFLNESVKTGKSISFVSWGKPREALYSEMQQVVYDRKDPFTAGEDLHAAFTEMTSEFKV